MFENLNGYQKLICLEERSARELQEKIRSITVPVHIVAIYGMGNKHYAWIQTTAKIKRKVKDDGTSTSLQD